jgi:predicted site-specific integrase-resolvase
VWHVFCLKLTTNEGKENKTMVVERKYRLAEVGPMLGYSIDHTRRLVRSGQLEAERATNGYYCVSHESIRKFTEARSRRLATEARGPHAAA